MSIVEELLDEPYSAYAYYLIYSDTHAEAKVYRDGVVQTFEPLYYSDDIFRETLDECNNIISVLGEDVSEKYFFLWNTFI